MTDFADFKAQIAEWEARADWSDALLTSFVRMAEEYISKDLRLDWNMITLPLTLFARQIALPNNWQRAELILGPTGTPIRFKSMDEFFNLTDKNAFGFYTILGRNIALGGTPDAVNGLVITLTYFGNVPVFSDTQNSWLYTKFQSLYLSAARMHAKLHAVGEEDQALGLKQAVDDEIAKLNAQYLISKASGSRLTRTRTRSFG